MNEQKIQEMLQRYFVGMTSLDEERELQRYFTEEKLSDTLKVYQPVFAYFAEERAVQPTVQKPTARTIRLNLPIITGIAASIAIMFLVGLPKMQSEKFVYYVDGQRIYNETAAIASAESKLQLLAESMQKANNSMAAFDKLQESSQSLQQFGKISNAYRQMEQMIGIDNN